MLPEGTKTPYLIEFEHEQSVALQLGGTWTKVTWLSSVFCCEWDRKGLSLAPLCDIEFLFIQPGLADQLMCLKGVSTPVTDEESLFLHSTGLHIPHCNGWQMTLLFSGCLVSRVDPGLLQCRAEGKTLTDVVFVKLFSSISDRMFCFSLFIYEYNAVFFNYY